MAEVDRWSIDKLDSSNWPTWKFQIKHLLLARGLWGLVNGTEALQDEANAQQQADYNKRSQKAFSTIVMAIGSSQLYLVTSCEGPVAAWTALRNHFERETLVNKLMLKKQYFRMEMEEGTSVEEHIKRMKELTDRLATINAPIAEEDQIVTFLGSLPATYSTLVTALEARDTVTLGYAQQALIREEQRLKGLTGGSVATGGSTGRALLGKQSDKGRKHSQKKVCFCVEKLVTSVGIVREISRVPGLSTRQSLLVLSLWDLTPIVTLMMEHLERHLVHVNLGGG